MSVGWRTVVPAVAWLLGCGGHVGALVSPAADGGPPRANDGGDPVGNDASASSCPASPCSLDPQCGCGPNEKCDLLVEGGGASVLCVAAGSGIAGQSCAQTTDCLPGLSCLNGACRPFCSTPNGPCHGDAPATPLGTCYQLTVGTAPIPRAFACQLACAPYPNTCGAGLSCLVGITSVATVVDCVGAGANALGAKCTTARDCVPGLGCTHTVAGGTCTQWCRLGGSYADCPTNQTCTPLTSTPVVGGASYGYCG